MSNSIGHNLIHHNLLALVVLEHQSKINSSCISSYNLFQVQANSKIRKSHITSKFWGKCLNLRKTKLPMGTNRVLSIFPQSVLATDPTSKDITSVSTVVNTSGTLVLHWGILGPLDFKGGRVEVLAGFLSGVSGSFVLPCFVVLLTCSCCDICLKAPACKLAADGTHWLGVVLMEFLSEPEHGGLISMQEAPSSILCSAVVFCFLLNVLL
ncbi:hypothetical protein LOK49_Contig2G00004 [Camellia lanceoleosa]|nr:hypothetical protein LOK49_Contig2G00004 [Camellia lanceoleosa]